MPKVASTASTTAEMENSGFLTSWATPATMAPIAAIVSLRRTCACNSSSRVISVPTRMMRGSSLPASSTHAAASSQVRPDAASCTCRFALPCVWRSSSTSGPALDQGGASDVEDRGWPEGSASWKSASAAPLRRWTTPSALSTTSGDDTASKVRRHSVAERRKLSCRRWRRSSAIRRSVTSVTTQPRCTAPCASRPEAAARLRTQRTRPSAQMIRCSTSASAPGDMPSMHSR
ncbi:hypothetical protein COSO111634_31820 [Corallococcus soli]